MKRPPRVIIPACIACKAMRQEETCAGACSERKLELVSADDYDQLTAAAAACRARIQELWAVAGELARTEPGPGEWQAAYEALQRSGRAALRRFRPAPGDPGDPPAPAETVTVWRCPDCGSVDAPQECIGVCIWHPASWVDAAAYEAERLRAAAGQNAERALAGLLRRLAFTTPRAGHWEQNWRALQAEARRPGALLTPRSDRQPGGGRGATASREAFGEPLSQPSDSGGG